MAILCAAAEPEIPDRGSATPRHRLDVIELEKAPRLATPAAGRHERASLPVALRHQTPDLRRYVSWIAALAPRMPARPLGRAELAPLEMPNENAKGVNEDLAFVGCRDLVR